MKSVTPDLIEELKMVGWFKEPHLSILAHAKFRCEYCGKDFLDRFNECFHAQLDHIYPKSKGGSNEASNLAAACVTCNALKWDYTPSGENRAEQIADAARYIQQQKKVEEENWHQYREIMSR